VTSRSYLSIGDVLTLLREEFPDVTISKIRFLESQGLVNPERSPSGYRKFFETDVERLRWVLRQQREHFLPLKVIRDRLADGDPGEEEAAPTETATHGNGRIAEPAHAGAGARGAASSRSGGSGGRAPTGGTGTVTALPPSLEPSLEPLPEQSQAGDEAMARILADASRRTARVPEAVDQRHSLHATPDPSAPTPPVPAPAAAAHSAPTVRAARHAPAEAPSSAPPGPGPAATGREHAASLLEGGAPAGAGGTPGAARATGGRAAAGRQGAAAPRAAEPGAAAPREKGAGGASGKSAGGQGARNVAAPSQPPEAGPAAPAAKAAPAAAAAPPESAGPPSGMVTGASLTAEELCAASGLSEVELAGLQGFGLIEAFMVAGIPTFDEDALTVANLAAEFRKYGIEARHLRPYRNAVDREMGLIEQVIIPLLRQRNPESRQRAVEAADELGALGQTMRATLMRAALRRHVGG
jgi:DNA-binding transcriptional MerR regulator